MYHPKGRLQSNWRFWGEYPLEAVSIIACHDTLSKPSQSQSNCQSLILHSSCMLIAWKYRETKFSHINWINSENVKPALSAWTELLETGLASQRHHFCECLLFRQVPVATVRRCCRRNQTKVREPLIHLLGWYNDLTKPIKYWRKNSPYVLCLPIFVSADHYHAYTGYPWKHRGSIDYVELFMIQIYSHCRLNRPFRLFSAFRDVISTKLNPLFIRCFSRTFHRVVRVLLFSQAIPFAVSFNASTCVRKSLAHWRSEYILFCSPCWMGRYLPHAMQT